VRVASACLIKDSVADGVARVPEGARKTLAIELPTGQLSDVAMLEGGQIRSAAVLGTARKLFDGLIFAKEGTA